MIQLVYSGEVDDGQSRGTVPAACMHVVMHAPAHWAYVCANAIQHFRYSVLVAIYTLPREVQENVRPLSLASTSRLSAMTAFEAAN